MLPSRAHWTTGRVALRGGISLISFESLVIVPLEQRCRPSANSEVLGGSNIDNAL